MKLKKKSGLMGAVIALSAASLVSVGFASWVISQGDTETISGSIIVDDAVQNVHEIHTKWVNPTSHADLGLENPPRVVFGHPASVKRDSDWFYNSNQVNETALNASQMKENLEFCLEVKIDNLVETDTPASIITGLELTVAGGHTIENGALPEGSNGYKEAFDAGLVAELPELAAPTSFGTLSSGTATFYLDIVFDWGDEFENDNPYIYFNEGNGNNSTGKAAAFGLMDNLYKALNGVTYTINIATK